jgi:predicted O-methyltransferase YrrM
LKNFLRTAIAAISPQAAQKISEWRWVRPALAAYNKRYLTPHGYQKSLLASAPIDNDGRPIAWYTYPALDMLKRVIRREWRVFEYGSGNSSLWWARQCGSITAVEHDSRYAEFVRSQGIPTNLELVLWRSGKTADRTSLSMAHEFFNLFPDLPSLGVQEKDAEHGLTCRGFEAYAGEIVRFGRGHFDVVIVDGMARSLTAYFAARFVKPSGIVIFDNSDRWQYNPGFRSLADAGFRRIDFYGGGPRNHYGWCTSIFCRDLEWLAGHTTVPETQPSDLTYGTAKHLD